MHPLPRTIAATLLAAASALPPATALAQMDKMPETLEVTNLPPLAAGDGMKARTLPLHHVQIINASKTAVEFTLQGRTCQAHRAWLAPGKHGVYKCDGVDTYDVSMIGPKGGGVKPSAMFTLQHYKRYLVFEDKGHAWKISEIAK